MISSDGIPTDTQIQKREFMGASAEDLKFENGYPLLYLNGKIYDMDLFLAQNREFKTTFINGLRKTEGVLFDEGLQIPFLGTVYNDNVYVVGINLLYHFSSTHDPAAGKMTEYIFDTKMYQLPDHELVPLQIDYEKNGITITSLYDGVNTHIAANADFDLKDELYVQNHLIYVKKGVSHIEFAPEYKIRSSVISFVGILMWIILYLML